MHDTCTSNCMHIPVSGVSADTFFLLLTINMVFRAFRSGVISESFSARVGEVTHPELPIYSFEL